ncbi:reverse transcriptase domain, Reverse transcriptase zinc-binding domain protein [Artemisia annua]|uniref:Reverse transcriptase domain, Reverse transcriptase zinc-binding domain protein n=1 Tax=Artemisia annua TaxID=35608 RepID=A0A2U1PJU6_ARTAN|nr:reverse transcriptase domain, Reverse transcriptase zinc-binding domain protein [Artemisia annua]
MWCDLSPIRDILTVRDITRAGLSLSDSVFDVIDNGSWRWPTDWFARFPNLVNLPVPTLLDDTNDGLCWRDLDGTPDHIRHSNLPYHPESLHQLHQLHLPSLPNLMEIYYHL